MRDGWECDEDLVGVTVEHVYADGVGVWVGVRDWDWGERVGEGLPETVDRDRESVGEPDREGTVRVREEGVKVQESDGVSVVVWVWVEGVGVGETDPGLWVCVADRDKRVDTEGVRVPERLLVCVSTSVQVAVADAVAEVVRVWLKVGERVLV